MTRLVRCLLFLLAMLAALPVQAQDVTRIDQAEAVRSDWSAQTPPPEGWVPVELRDLWEKRWPDHDGVVWYRVRWQQADASQPIGLLLDYTCLAAAVSLNGQPIDRDASLVEPLSRKWHVPRYYTVPPALLREGQNELLVRVSGLAAYQPAFGTVSVGDPVVLRGQYERERFARRDMQIFDAAVGLVLAAMIGIFWLLRPQDTLYGWYALSAVFGRLYDWNFIAGSPWPFRTTDGWQAFIAAVFVASAATHTIFLLRFSERQWPRFERALLALAGVALMLALLLPQWMGPLRNLYVSPTILFLYVVSVVFVVFALRSGRRDFQVLAACISVPLLVSLHDLGVYMGWYGGVSYLGSFTSPVMLLGMGFVLAYRFAQTMKRVEGFNAELQREVQAATTTLADTLNQQHALALAHSRAGERLQLVRDLHDGFGGTLVGAITRLQQAPDDTPKAEVVDLLRDMRDDLRLVIDTTAQEQADLATLIAPLRHRASRLLEAADIDAHWQVDGLEGLQLGPGRSLDLLRLLQEALTNVFKHSRAARVDVQLQRAGDRLQLRVRDDGVGLAGARAPAEARVGAGLASMRHRAQRLGAELRIAGDIEGKGTTLELDLPLAV
ncbi:ATP-binding protein [Pseudoxanthomonas sp. Root65]|uniref:sensor histidine kinase n=1 Tax=Pseudoxanthomonas sp. Root65 TaxID=1736576 RepID=UPI0012E3CF47|nr:ATP-binding protein [Pseudoxanthomonas sp. Root65]